MPRETTTELQKKRRRIAEIQQALMDRRERLQMVPGYRTSPVLDSLTTVHELEAEYASMIADIDLEIERAAAMSPLQRSVSRWISCWPARIAAMIVLGVIMVIYVFAPAGLMTYLVVLTVAVFLGESLIAAHWLAFLCAIFSCLICTYSETYTKWRWRKADRLLNHIRHKLFFFVDEVPIF